MTDKAVCVGGDKNHKDMPEGDVVGTSDEQVLENKTLKGALGNVKTFNTEGPTDDVDVEGVDILFIDTSSDNVTIGGFKNGKEGQGLLVVVIDNSNNLVLEHNEGGGDQDIFLNGNDDVTLTATYGGFMLVCDGDNWYEVSAVFTSDQSA